MSLPAFRRQVRHHCCQPSPSLLKQKHPHGKDVSDSVLLPDAPIKVHEVRFEAINSKIIQESALKRRDGAGPSGLDGAEF